MLEVIVKQNTGTIEWNYEELKANLQESLKKYNQVVTFETIKDAKSDMALLNKVDKAIGEKMKEIKSLYCAPYIQFEAQAKELKQMVLSTRSQIDEQVKMFDEQEKAEKKELIIAYFNEKQFSLVGLERLFDERWLNKTTTEKKWKEELDNKIAQIEQDMNMISMFGSMNEDEKATIQAYYLDTLDLCRAKAQYDDLQAKKERLAQLEADKKAVFSIPKENVSPVIERVDYAQEMAAEREKEELYTRTFTVFDCTREQIIALGNYMNANGIKFRKEGN